MSTRSLLQIWQMNYPKQNHARLGLIVSKKVAKRANRRNYMKRVIREWFRQNKHALPACDFVIRVRTAFDRNTANLARIQLAELLLPRVPFRQSNSSS